MVDAGQQQIHEGLGLEGLLWPAAIVRIRKRGLIDVAQREKRPCQLPDFAQQLACVEQLVRRLVPVPEPAQAVVQVGDARCQRLGALRDGVALDVLAAAFQLARDDGQTHAQHRDGARQIVAQGGHGARENGMLDACSDPGSGVGGVSLVHVAGEAMLPLVTSGKWHSAA